MPLGKNQSGLRMWPFSGMSLALATWLSDIANIVLLLSLVLGVVSTLVIVKTAGIKEEYWDEDRRHSSERIAELTTQSDELRRDTAVANERAAEATRKANEAELKLIEFRKSRRQILAEPGNVDAFVEKIKPFAGTDFDIGPRR